MRTYSKKEYFDAFHKEPIDEGDFLSYCNHKEQWCDCVYYFPLGSNFSTRKSMIAYKKCTNCFGYGVPPIAWSEVNK